MSGSATPARPTVHVVDPDAASRDSLRALLDLCPWEVRTYGAAEELLALRPTGPGCVIVEAELPGMSGLELLERLRAGAGAIPVIVMAAHGDVPMAVRALRAGAASYIPKKPFVEHVLLLRLRELLEPRRATGELAT